MNIPEETTEIEEVVLIDMIAGRTVVDSETEAVQAWGDLPIIRTHSDMELHQPGVQNIEL